MMVWVVFFFGFVVFVLVMGSVISVQCVEVVDCFLLRVCVDFVVVLLLMCDGKGVENCIVDLFVYDLGVFVIYVWFLSGIGFYCNMFNLWCCDIVMGIVIGVDIVQIIIFYYWLSYVLVMCVVDCIVVISLIDLVLCGCSVGVQLGLFVIDVLVVVGLFDGMCGYLLMFDGGIQVVGKWMIDDFFEKCVDVVVVWGLIGGYFVGQYLGVLIVMLFVSGSGLLLLVFDIGMVVCFGEVWWWVWIEMFICGNWLKFVVILIEVYVLLFLLFFEILLEIVL